MTGNRAKAANSHARWIALAVAGASLTGCMSSALDPSHIQVPGQQTFSFAGEGFAPRPSEDVITGSTQAVEPAQDMAEPTMTALAGPTPETNVLRPMAEVETDTALAETQTMPADAPTARIDAAAGSQPMPAPRPPVSGFAARTGNLLGLFSGNRQAPARKALIPTAEAAPKRSAAELWSAPAAEKQDRPIIASASAPGLPGVDRNRALGLNSTQPDEEDEGRPVQLASAAGLARLAPNGLRVQHDGVDVKCLKPALVQVLSKIERHYGRKVMVTSGYRNPTRNKAAHGSSNSLHMYCSAADIQVEGVTKWQLAEYLRDMPGRGGVGTYCYTDSVHIDIGPQRDWNWRCARKK